MLKQFVTKNFIVTVLVMLWVLLIPWVYHQTQMPPDTVSLALALVGAIGTSYHVVNFKKAKAGIESDPEEKAAPSA